MTTENSQYLRKISVLKIFGFFLLTILSVNKAGKYAWVRTAGPILLYSDRLRKKIEDNPNQPRALVQVDKKYYLKSDQYIWNGIFLGSSNSILNSLEGKFLSTINGTSIIYETPNPYSNLSKCKAEFFCPDDKLLGYAFERFDIDNDGACDDDFLGMYDI